MVNDDGIISELNCEFNIDNSNEANIYYQIQPAHSSILDIYCDKPGYFGDFNIFDDEMEYSYNIGYNNGFQDGFGNTLTGDNHIDGIIEMEADIEEMLSEDE